MQNTIETAIIFPDDEIKAEHIQIIDSGLTTNAFEIPNEGIDIDNEILPKYYKTAIEKSNGNKTKAAILLGLEPHTFRARLKKLGIY